jgi:hypothetical protein
MQKPDLSYERMQRLSLAEAINELRENLEYIDRQIDEAFPDPDEAAAFRAHIAPILAEHGADHAALDEMEAGLTGLLDRAPAAGTA